MNDVQIRIFLAVVKAGSFSKAEESEHISKQAMLKQINHLEDELGFRLLARSRSGITLTQPGERFYKGMLKMSREMSSLIRNCRQADEETETLRVGNVEHQALLAPVTQVFAARYPRIRIQQVVHPNHSGEWRVHNGIQDVAESFRLAWILNSHAFSYTPLTKVPYVALMRPAHPLARRKKVSFEELSLHETMFFPVMLEEEYVQVIRSAFSGNPGNLKERSDVDNQVPAAYECIDFDRILITANPFIEEIKELVRIPLAAGWMREYGIIYREPMTPVVRKYVETALEVYGEP